MLISLLFRSGHVGRVGSGTLVSWLFRLEIGHFKGAGRGFNQRWELQQDELQVTWMSVAMTSRSRCSWWRPVVVMKMLLLQMVSDFLDTVLGLKMKGLWFLQCRGWLICRWFMMDIGERWWRWRQWIFSVLGDRDRQRGEKRGGWWFLLRFVFLLFSYDICCLEFVLLRPIRSNLGCKLVWSEDEGAGENGEKERGRWGWPDNRRERRGSEGDASSVSVIGGGSVRKLFFVISAG